MSPGIAITNKDGRVIAIGLHLQDCLLCLWPHDSLSHQDRAEMWGEMMKDGWKMEPIQWKMT